MALILNIETSTEVCSVALAKNGIVINQRENQSGQNHSKLLTLFIKELLDESKVISNQIDAVAVSGGPGSYTGLRIGVSVAKGICYASQLPLIAISSLDAMAEYVMLNLEKFSLQAIGNFIMCPMIDARRMEVYTAFYNHNGEIIRNIQADIIDHQSFLEFLNLGKVLFFGNGAKKCREIITHSNAIFIENVITSASHMALLSQRNFNLGKFADVAYYEPFYLKDFVTTTPVKNIF